MVTQTFTLATFEFFLLVMMRIASFFFAAPFFSNDGPPNRTMIGFAALVSILVMYAVPPEIPVWNSVVGYALCVVRESITGLLIGYAANICNAIIIFAGSMIDMDIGLSMAQEFDPSLRTQVTITGQIYNQFFILLFILSNMHHYLLKAVIESFTLIPLGGMKFQSDELLTAFVMFFTDLFIIAFRIMMPIFATVLILNCVLGVMAKVAPQMNMFSVGVQIKVLVGLAIIFVMVFLFPEAVQLIFTEIRRVVVAVVKGMY